MLKLYHYSKPLYHSLKTRTKSGVATAAEIQKGLDNAKTYNNPGSYHDHVSFFFDPVPLTTLAKLFKGKNDFWIAGNEIYEYTIDVDSLEPTILYSVVETPKQIEYLDKTEWIDTDEFLIHYCAEETKLKKQWGETGTGLAGLKRQINIYKGKTESFYVAASKRDDFVENIKKYAACVPHLMLYPLSGEIKIESTATAVVGKDDRIPLTNTSMESFRDLKPLYLKW